MTPKVEQERKAERRDRTPAQGIAVALVFFLLGMAVSAFWFSSRGNAGGQVASLTSPDVGIGDVSGIHSSEETHGRAAERTAEELEELAAAKVAIEKVKTASLSEGTRILREAALAEFQKAVQELEDEQKQAKQDFLAGQANGSEAEQKAATRRLQELQLEQMEKLKAIAAKSKLEIDTFQQLRGARP